jgi:hypothetical protein
LAAEEKFFVVMSIKDFAGLPDDLNEVVPGGNGEGFEGHMIGWIGIKDDKEGQRRSAGFDKRWRFVQGRENFFSGIVERWQGKAKRRVAISRYGG